MLRKEEMTKRRSSVIKQEWQRFLSLPRNRRVLYAVALYLLVVLFFFSRFILWIENRPGCELFDPILAVLPAMDCSIIAFSAIYGGICLAAVALLSSPYHLLHGMLSYAFLFTFRILTLWLLPLDPPDGMIPLDDPIVHFFGTGGILLTRDLFFSGHTAGLFLLMLVVEKYVVRLILACFTALVAVAVLLQHVHYTIDVLAAFPFAATAVFVSSRILQKTICFAHPSTSEQVMDL